MSELELGPVWLSLELAAVTVIVLLLLATPLAWWLAFTRRRARVVIEAIVALPLVLPPTVLGFYLLILLGPRRRRSAASGPALSDSTLTFSFAGLVIASVIYSLPVRRAAAASRVRGRRPRAARGRRDARRDSVRRRSSASRRRSPFAGYVSALVLSFAHTLGEFGVVLMVGGNIPGRTQGDLDRGLRARRDARVRAGARARGRTARVLVRSCSLSIYALNRRVPLVRA